MPGCEGRLGLRVKAVQQSLAQVLSEPPAAGGETGNRFSLTSLSRNQPCRYPDLRSSLQSCERVYICVVQTPRSGVFCYGNLRAMMTPSLQLRKLEVWR